MIKMLKLLGQTMWSRLKFRFFNLFVSILIVVSSVYKKGKKNKRQIEFNRRG